MAAGTPRGRPDVRAEGHFSLSLSLSRFLGLSLFSRALSLLCALRGAVFRVLGGAARRVRA